MLKIIPYIQTIHIKIVIDVNHEKLYSPLPDKRTLFAFIFMLSFTESSKCSNFFL